MSSKKIILSIIAVVAIAFSIILVSDYLSSSSQEDGQGVKIIKQEVK